MLKNRRVQVDRNEENVVNLRQKMNGDRRFAFDELAEATAVSWISSQVPAQDVNQRRFSGKFVFRMPPEVQR